MRRPLGLLFLTVLAFCTSCRHREGPTLRPLSDGQVTIKIVNNNSRDVVLYVVHTSYRDRLGLSTANTTNMFPLKFRNLGAGREFQLLADPVGSREPFRTEVLHPLDGQILTWTLESDFARSHLTIF